MLEILKSAFQGMKDTAAKVKGAMLKIRNLMKFFASGVGTLVLYLIGVILLAIFVYLIATVLFITITRILGIDAGASDYKQNSALLQSLANSGYDAMISSEDLINYYAFEYSVLMDAARFLEETGTTKFEKYNLSTVDCDEITRAEWAAYAAACVQGATEESAGGAESLTGISGINTSSSNGTSRGRGPEGVLEDDEYEEFTTDFSNKSAAEGLFYRVETNEYTDEDSLVPYLQIVRFDENLRYFLEIKGEGPEFEVIQKKGAAFTLDDLVINGKHGLGLLMPSGSVSRFNGTATGPGSTMSEAAQFIYEHVFAVMFNRTLNQSNMACLTVLDASYRPKASAEPLDMYAQYPESLFYWNFRTNLVFKIPLRVLLDRFLPNAELLSSWRYLNDEEAVLSSRLSSANTVVTEIQKIYTEACLKGESFGKENYLLKEVSQVTDGIGLGSTSIDVLSPKSRVTYENVELLGSYYDGGSPETKQNSYLALNDSRKLKKNPKKEDELKESNQTFSASYKEDFMDDVKLAVSAYVRDYGGNGDLSSAVSEAGSKSTISEEITSTTREINVYKPNSNGGYLVCCAEVENQIGYANRDYSRIREHYGISENEPITKIGQESDGTTFVETASGRHTHKYADNPGSAPDEYKECFVPLLSVSCIFDPDTGLRRTAVVVSNSGKKGAYIVQSKDTGDYSSMSNGETFAKFEANTVQSNTFRNWEIALGGGGDSPSAGSTDPSTGGSTGEAGGQQGGTGSTGSTGSSGVSDAKPGKNSSYEFWIVKDFWEGYNLDIPKSLDCKVEFNIDFDYEAEYTIDEETGEMIIEPPDDSKVQAAISAVQDACTEEWDKEKIQDEVAMGNFIYTNYDLEAEFRNDERIEMQSTTGGGLFKVRKRGADRIYTDNVPSGPGTSVHYSTFGPKGSENFNSAMSSHGITFDDQKPQAYSAEDIKLAQADGGTIWTSSSAGDFRPHFVTFDQDQGIGDEHTSDYHYGYIDALNRVVINRLKSGDYDSDDFLFTGSYAIERKPTDYKSTGGRIYSGDALLPTENAAPKQGIALPYGGMYEGTCTTAPGLYGETTITQKYWLNMKKTGHQSSDNTVDIDVKELLKVGEDNCHDFYDRAPNLVERANELLGKDDFKIKSISLGKIVVKQTKNDDGVEALVEDYMGIMPVRRTICPITQRIIKKTMDFYLVKDAVVWSANKEFHNFEEHRGEFVDKENPYYLISNNPFASGLVDLVSNYRKLEYRSQMYSPIFGGANDQDIARENDVRLMLSEWEDASKNELHAADHYIRDLKALIDRAKGFENQYGSFEGISGPDGRYVNENSYTFMYIPNEILAFDPLTCEKTFWMDRLISTSDRRDRMDYSPYDYWDQFDIELREKEQYMRSKLPTFTWQIVDYDKYEETGGRVYALWPFGATMNRMLYAVAANASSEEAAKIPQWGGYSVAHRAADLYGRVLSERIYEDVIGDFNEGNIGDASVDAYYRKIGNLVDANGKPLSSRPDYIDAPGGPTYVTYDDYLKSHEAGHVDTSNSDLFEYEYGVSDGFEGIFGLYYKNTPVLFKLGRWDPWYSSTCTAVYAYQLYKQLLGTRDYVKAATDVYNKVRKEVLWNEIRAIAPGIVQGVGGNSTSGFWVRIVHEYESDSEDAEPVVTSSYCHMKRFPLVQEGQYVGAGTLLGYEGTTGKSLGYHMHNTIKQNGTPLSPVEFYYPFFTPFYFDEKAKQVDYDEASEYLSIERTVFPYRQAGGSPGVETDGEGYVKIKNYTPNLALVDNYELLPTEEHKMIQHYELPFTDRYVSDIGLSDYEGERLRSNSDYFDESFQQHVLGNFGKITEVSFGTSIPDFSNLENAQEIWNFLYGFIGNSYGVAGVMGNMMAESGLRPEAVNLDLCPDYGDAKAFFEGVIKGQIDIIEHDHCAWGLVQWHGTNLHNLYNYVKGDQSKMGGLYTQLGCLRYQLENEFKGLLKLLQNSNSVQEATRAFMLDYERPGDTGAGAQATRGSYALGFFSMFSGIGEDGDLDIMGGQ